MTIKKNKQKLIAGTLIFIARLCFIVGAISLIKLSLGTSDTTVKPVLLFILGAVFGAVGFYLVGSSKVAWLQLPHEALAITGVGMSVYGGLELLEGSDNLTLWFWVLAGPLFILSWRYCHKKNVYKA